MARQRLDFDRLESRRLLAADGLEPMTMSFAPEVAAEVTTPAAYVLSSPYSDARVVWARSETTVIPPLHIGPFMQPQQEITTYISEPIDGMVHIWYVDQSVWTSESGETFCIGVSWGTTIPVRRTDGAPESHASEGTTPEVTDASGEHIPGIVIDKDAVGPVTGVNADDAAVAILASVALEIHSPSESSSEEADALAVAPAEEVVVEEVLYGEPELLSSIAEEVMPDSEPITVVDEQAEEMPGEIGDGLTSDWESELG